MKKTQYIAPATFVAHLYQRDGILVGASGQTSENSAKKDDDGNYNNEVKRGGDYNVWGDDWTR